MKTGMKKLKITTIILAIILITMVAFGGVYIKTQNRMENKVKDYSFGRELQGGRVVELEVANKDKEETKPNLTVENYKIVKKTIENRLNDLGADDYTISLDEVDGTIRVELPENQNIDTYIYFLTASGEVKIAEKDAGTELLSDSMIKNAKYTYTANVEGVYQVFMDIYLTEEGQAKIEEIKNNYAIFPDEIEEIEAQKADDKKEETSGEEKTENTETEQTEETKKIAQLTIAGSEYDISKIEKNNIRIEIGGETSNTANINNNLAAAAELALLVNSGKYPLVYDINVNHYVFSDITETQILYFAITIAIVMLIVFIVLSIKYKTNGMLSSISFVGFISLLSLLIRYTNVNISIEGIGAIILVFLINIIVNKKLLNEIKNGKKVNEVIMETYKDVFLKIIPVIIISLIFCFAGVANLSSFGMIMFWGLLLIAVYNAIVTKTLLKLKESK